MELHQRRLRHIRATGQRRAHHSRAPRGNCRKEIQGRIGLRDENLCPVPLTVRGIFACSAKHDTCATPSSGDATPSRSPHAHPRTRPSPARGWMLGLETDVAFLALRVVRARLDRDHDGLLVFVVGVILFRVAAAVNLLADLLVAAAPVVVLASRVAVSRFAPHTPRGVVAQCSK